MSVGLNWRLIVTNCLLYKKVDSSVCFFEKCIQIYSAIRRAVRPSPQNSAKAKKLGGDRAARKSPIGVG
ncbi:hypothetical protein CN543_17280 [Bacillus toyonensis]|uniref:Spermidine/putrescine ABC transporter ATP-binding protein n=1 Tax=Bacillus toyonensis TaxID=155322 RepID=A0AB36T6P1_9BACI|nr:hypothetical protein CON55_14780 [Bacillus toyonensis]PEC64494.1 hypothetical protein CON62_26685 [Bacillus toyonensis]PED20169.1 hypothetical protein CON63_11450 [Bacillus toyonensis]PEE79802.1 hypothetical protein COO15_26470 [Bacillus toyonensis]PEJ89489.1 hypothetical protein CN687_23435 [Bacillus toyonensis]